MTQSQLAERLLMNVSCQACGYYQRYQGETDIPQGKKYIVSGVTRNKTESIYRKMAQNKNINHERFFKERTVIAPETIDEILQGANFPKTLIEAVDKVILYIGNDTYGLDYSETVNFTKHDYPLIYAKNSDLFIDVLKKTKELGYIEGVTTQLGEQGLGKYKLSIKGWERYLEIRNLKNKNKAFVAMWFPDKDSEWSPILEKGNEAIEKVLKELGYEPPYRVDKKEHNNKICDEIIASINESSLVIVDCTGHRPNVYFESGYAKGLKTPVVWMCNEGYFKANQEQFDTRQYSHIVWKDGADLEEKLRNRIKATIFL
ncbi:MAG: hypothetical protein GY817_05715 [bacterium]|nr:hypothetical protein [bacterium]